MFYGLETSNSARWAFLAFIIVIFIFFIFYICTVNRRRARYGTAPMRGTSWMMPPSYNQAQEGQALPVYTENANPNQDFGYYDQQGNFHANPEPSKAAMMNSESTTYVPMNNMTTNSAPDGSGVAYPDQSYQSHHFEEDYPNYYANNQQRETYYRVGSSSQSPNAENPLPNYSPPSGPPPSKKK